MAHVDIETSWKDSGHDCRHCGGRVWQRTDREMGQAMQQCYQCEACGCQWTLAGDVRRVGHLAICRTAQREQEAERKPAKYPIPPRLMVVGGVAILLILVFLGGLAALRFLIPIMIALFVFTAVYRYGREHQWW